MDSTEPEHIGRWRVVRTLARGGMATVYAVVDPRSGERFAIKLLTQPGASVPRLLQEYRALTRIDHPNIVRVYQLGSTDAGIPFVVMEMLDGVPAQVRVKAIGRPGERVRTAEAVRIARDVALALGHLHARGIVHRDLKSSNVMVQADGEAKLLDFGTARLIDAYDPITQLGEFVGTFAYASPEQLTGGAVDARSDLYSLGVLLFRMLCGRRPFEGDNAHDLARNHLDTAPPDPGVLVPGLPRELADAVLQLLQKLPANRQQDARTVAEQLAPFAAEVGSRGLGHAPILGRDTAFAVAQRFLGEARPGSVLFVAGNEGCGRRTFIEVVSEEAVRRGARVVAIGGDDDAFQRLVWAVRDLRSEVDGDVMDADPDTASPLPETIVAVANLLAVRALAENRVTLLAAPGFWAVPPTAASAILRVMDLVAQRGAPVVLLASSRAPAPKGPRISSVPLRPLTGAETSAVAAHWLGVTSIPPELARRLLRASGGLPGALTELVRALPSATAQTPLVIPVSLRDDALARIEELGNAERRILEAIALADRDLDALRVAWLADDPEGEVRERLERLRNEGMIWEEGGFWCYRDGIVGELVRSHTRPVRRLLLARRLAAVAEDLLPSEALAEACRLAGRIEEAAEIAVRWAWPIVRAGAWAEVLPLFERLASGNPALGPATGVRFWTLYGESLAELQLSPNLANEAIGRAAALAQDASDSAEVELAASRLARARSDPHAERSLLQAAIARLDAESSTEDGRAAEGRAHLADLLVRSGELPAAVSAAGLALRGGGHDLVRYATTLGYTQLAVGQLGDAELAFRGAEARARAEGRTAWRAVAGLVLVLTAQGRYSDASDLGEAGERSARSGAPAPRLAALQIAMAELDLALCRHGLARKRLDQAMDALHGEVTAQLEARVALVRARIAWDGGEQESAVALVETALQSPGVEVARGGAAEVRGLRGILLCGCGRADIGWLDLAASLTALIEMGARPAVARLAELATLIIDDAALVEPMWSPLSEWLVEECARSARVARAVNRLRYVHSRGWDDGDARLQVRVLWDDLVEQLIPADAAALAVHPWARLVGATNR